jgi:hypothetical protein
LNKYKIDTAGTKGFADDYLENYKKKDKGEDNERAKTVKAFENALKKDYTGQTKDQIQAAIIADAEIPTNTIVTAEKKKKIAEEAAPRIELIFTKLTARTTDSAQEKLAKLLYYLELKYDGEEAAKGKEFTEINDNIKDLNKFIDGGTDAVSEHALFETLGTPGKEIVKGLRTQMMKKKEAMELLRKETPGGPSMSPWVIFSIIAVGLVLLGAVYYFLLAKKDDEEVEE